MDSIQNIEEEVINEFAVFDDWTDKYEYIIDMGKSLAPLEEIYKKDENKVTGCQSQVWLSAEMKDGNIYYKADSDAIITKGLIALLIRVLSGQKPEDVMDAKLGFLDKIGMKEHLSPTRSNGLMSMIAHMRKYAEKAKMNKPLSLN